MFMSCDIIYLLQTQKFLLGANFHRKATPTKIIATKIFTDEKLATTITVSHPHPRKFIPAKINP